MVSEQKDMIEIEKSRFKQMLVAAHPEHAETILAEHDEDDPDVAEGFDYDTFDENTEGFVAEDYSAMTEMLQALEGQGYHYEERED